MDLQSVVQRHKIHHLLFIDNASFLTEIYTFLFCFYIMLGSYATDVKVTVLIMICMTLGEQHC